MGTKGGKPLSALEKRQMRMMAKKEAKKVKEEKKPTTTVKAVVSIDPGLISKALEEVNNSGFITTFMLAQKLGIKMSIAKKILKELIRSGSVKLIARNRRVILVEKK
jgi:small subunit ribosomal protein S25e